ncbi:MAG: malate transporter [Synechococcus sp. s2_metabat2_7]|nr:malate transporter [Synechococcus sp. s2_metabat2_7]
MGLLLKGGLNSSLVSTAAIAAAAIMVMLLMLNSWREGGNQRLSPTLQLGSCVGNTAYFGIPVALALLPPEALSISIGYDLGATLLCWGLGPIWLAGARPEAHPYRWRELVNHLSSSPASRGLLGALLVMATPWQATITTALWMPSRVVIVLALIVVGMRLAGLAEERSAATHPEQRDPEQRHPEQTQRPHANLLNAALVCKLLLFPAFLFGLSLILPISSIARQALVLQAAAPTAISVLLIAETEQADSTAAAQLIWRSTLIAMITIPIWAWLLKTMAERLGT